MILNGPRWPITEQRGWPQSTPWRGGGWVCVCDVRPCNKMKPRSNCSFVFRGVLAGRRFGQRRWVCGGMMETGVRRSQCSDLCINHSTCSPRLWPNYYIIYILHITDFISLNSDFFFWLYLIHCWCVLHCSILQHQKSSDFSMEATICKCSSLCYIWVCQC